MLLLRKKCLIYSKRFKLYARSFIIFVIGEQMSAVTKYTAEALMHHKLLQTLVQLCERKDKKIITAYFLRAEKLKVLDVRFFLFSQEL